MEVHSEANQLKGPDTGTQFHVRHTHISQHATSMVASQTHITYIIFPIKYLEVTEHTIICTLRT